MNVVVTGAAGFLGRHAVEALRGRGENVRPLDVGDDDAAWRRAFDGVDAVVHLAGANRPSSDGEFTNVNVGVTREVVARSEAAGRTVKILLSSTVHASGEGPYGRSKRQAEEALAEWATRGGEAVIFRLANLFGKWGRPDYNSVVATWCHRIARGLPYEMSDSGRVVSLLHVDDAITAFLRELDAPPQPGVARVATAGPVFGITLGELRDRLEGFRASRDTRVLPDLSDPLVARLHATYMAYLPGNALAYDLDQRTDPRGTLAEFLKSPYAGQIFVSRTKPGIVRGDHFHDSKVEKFLVLEGEAVIRFRHLPTGDTAAYRVSGTDFRVVDIPPGWTHHIESAGSGELIVLFWASEIFNPARPDTFGEPVGPVSGPGIRKEPHHA